ncbi:MAG: MotA/TolQ/ExbB proton channel family protein [Chlamydiales bacterium]
MSNFYLTLGEYLSNANLLLILIVLCSLIGFTIFIERILRLNQAECDTNSLIIRLRQCIIDGDIIKAITICEEVGGSISNILKSGLSKHHRSKEEIENAMELAGAIEIAELEQNAKILSILAHVTPLIGLLGTVLGFIQAFAEMRISGLVDISTTRLGEAMEYALVTTAAGLVVAIPSIIAYNYLVSRVERFALEMQTTAANIVDLLMNRQEEQFIP